MIRVFAQCARRPWFGSRSGYVLFPPVTFGACVGVRAWGVSSNGTVSLVSSRFGDTSKSQNK